MKVLLQVPVEGKLIAAMPVWVEVFGAANDLCFNPLDARRCAYYDYNHCSLFKCCMPSGIEPYPLHRRDQKCRDAEVKP